MAAAETISVQCPCGKRLKAPATAVGRKAKCPNCGNLLTIAAPAPKPKAPQRDEIDDALYDLAADAQSAAAAAPQQARTVCPNCQQPMASGAVLCTACGYDTRTGKSLAGAKASSSSTRSPTPASRGFPPSLQTKVNVEKPQPTGSMLKGAIISAVFAFVGALVWFAIAKATHREIGWIAWGVGIAAGFGMMIGYNGTSVSAGAVAAALAVGGILLGKWMVFSVVFSTELAKFNKMVDSLSDDQKLIISLSKQQLKKQGLDTETSTHEQDAAARAEADKIIARMDAKTKAAEIEKARAEMRALRDELVAKIDKMELFRKEMFGPADLIFFVIAIASAFKVATFGGQVEGST